jgi:DNA recombination protein RmuC
VKKPGFFWKNLFIVAFEKIKFIIMEITWMEVVGLLVAGIFIGCAIGWLWAKGRHGASLHAAQDEARKQFDGLQQEYMVYKATVAGEVQGLHQETSRLQGEIKGLQEINVSKAGEIDGLRVEVATATAGLQAANDSGLAKNEEIKAVKAELAGVRQELEVSGRQLARAEAENRSLEDKLKVQLKEMEGLNQKFSTEFENVANRILDAKSEKFTALNKTNLQTILEPLGKTITEFKEQVNKVYDTESKERFSLGAKVKELADLNQQLSQDAKNLTRALKSDAKTQGRWGEVLLESILEKSGLGKGVEYFMEYQLFDVDGKPLVNELRGTKMRPDALVKYPDDRHVIIDSKVSINAFVRFTESEDTIQQQVELAAHVQAIKNHIQDLQSKAYDDYDKTLDFVMMFIPSEAAYIAALQADPNLWFFAFERRILLVGPSNLIISLKLIVDLWKREYQNRNAQAIADRGALLYQKFVGFVSSLQSVGGALDSARTHYDRAFGQLSTGNGNLVFQATMLKKLGVKTKSDLPPTLVSGARAEDERDDETEGQISA